MITIRNGQLTKDLLDRHYRSFMYLMTHKTTLNRNKTKPGENHTQQNGAKEERKEHGNSRAHFAQQCRI
jgi:hypothetical protein